MLTKEGDYKCSESIYCVLGSIVGWTNGTGDIEEDPKNEMYSDDGKRIMESSKGRLRVANCCIGVDV